jgi:nitrogenase iron protein NifH
MKETRQIAIYGKGGIGKSTISSNLSAAFSTMNLKSAQIGCDPKADSVNTLMDGQFIETISDITGQCGNSEESLSKAIYRGYNHILCMEAGGPPPGQGCAGRGVLVALDLIRKHKIFEKNNIEMAVYDVLGDIVCGGFAQPIRHGFAEEVYIATSGEYMSLYAANNIAFSIKQFAEQGLKVRIGGIIGNLRNVAGEEEIINNFAKKLGIPVIKMIPRSDFVQKSEVQGKTVVEFFPESEQAEIYFELARKILANTDNFIPKPVTRQDLISLLNVCCHCEEHRDEAIYPNSNDGKIASSALRDSSQ